MVFATKPKQETGVVKIIDKERVLTVSTDSIRDMRLYQLVYVADECIDRIADAVVEKMSKCNVRCGEWIKDRLISTGGGTYGVYRCSVCEHSYQDVGYGFDYCPNCGAKMDGERKDGAE